MSASPIILLGFHRSGTTALARVLQRGVAAKGGLFTINGKLLYYLRRWLGPEDVAGRHFQFDEVVHALRRVHPYGQESETAVWFARTEASLETAALAVCRNNALPSTHLEIARSIVAEAYGGWPLWGEKYNEDMLDIAYLEAILDHPRYVYLFRDPADVASSMSRWSEDKRWNPTGLENALAKWCHWNEKALDALSLIEPSRVMVVEYGQQLCAPVARAALAAFSELHLDGSCFADFFPAVSHHSQRVDYRTSVILQRLRDFKTS